MIVLIDSLKTVPSVVGIVVVLHTFDRIFGSIRSVEVGTGKWEKTHRDLLILRALVRRECPSASRIFQRSQGRVS
jgi:hypothetical protein